MSSFKGRMRCYTNLCIDRFDGINLKCTAFFLSHCHKDHMTGLDDKKFEICLSSRQDVFLYCSEITRLLLQADEEYKPLKNFIKTLEVGTKHQMKIPNDHVGRGGCEVAVTPISAGHCPGSVMFLFEGDQGNCLYTGDFRWEPNYASTVAAFKSSNRLMQIDHLHIDTTFCVPAALHIPSRVECAEATLSLVATWLEHSPRHQVAFFCPARYGYEFLLREIATRLGYKIHVSATKYWLYEQIPDLCGLFTSDPNQARIHACCPKMRYKASIFPPCLSRADSKRPTGGESQDGGYQVLNIRPCAMWFTTKTGQAALKRLNPKSPRGLQRVCYSMHSSYSEIQDLVSYLQPRQVWPNVIPASDRGSEQVQERLDSFLEKSHPLRPKVTSSEKLLHDAPVRLNLDLLSTDYPQKISSLFRFVPNDSDSSDGCVFDSPDSVPEIQRGPQTVDNKETSNLEQPQPLTQPNDLDQDELSVICPDDEGEEADSDLHLRLSQNSDCSGESQLVQDQFQDNLQSTEPHSSSTTLLQSNRNQQIRSFSVLGSESDDKPQTSKRSKVLSEEKLFFSIKSYVSKSPDPSSLKSESHTKYADQANELPTFSSKCHKSETELETENTYKPAGQVLLCDKSLSDEEDVDVIDSSPQFKSKVFTSLLKGQGAKISTTIPCNDPVNPTFLPMSSSGRDSLQNRQEEQPNPLFTNGGSHTKFEPALLLSVKRCILTSQSSESLLMDDEGNVGNLVNLHHASVKKRRLSSGSGPDNCVTSSACTDHKHKLRTTVDPYRGADSIATNEVYVIPSDSEETDEDSEKMLKPLKKSNSSSTGPWLKTRNSEIIDLTGDK